MDTARRSPRSSKVRARISPSTTNTWRTLRPLAWDPPASTDGTPDRDAPPARWTPKQPEEILALAVCDPACGSGTFPLAALRFLTDSLYAALQHHRRIEPDGERSLVRLLGLRGDGTGHGGTQEAECAQPEDEGPEPVIDTRLGDELIPCPPDDERWLRVAEDPADYRASTPPEDRQPDLFE